jgi:hypothetical protein
MQLYLHAFLTSALGGGEWSSSHSGHFTAGKRIPGTHWTGCWVGPSAGLDAVAMRKNPVIAPRGNWTQVVQTVA